MCEKVEAEGQGREQEYMVRDNLTQANGGMRENVYLEALLLMISETRDPVSRPIPILTIKTQTINLVVSVTRPRV